MVIFPEDLSLAVKINSSISALVALFFAAMAPVIKISSCLRAAIPGIFP